MSDRTILMQMAKALLRDIQEIQQRGAGYYTTAPFVERYNALAAKVQVVFADTDSRLLDTFQAIVDTTSVDPMDKMKTTQHVIVEVGQMLAFMETVMREGAEEETAPAEPDEPSPAEESACG